MSGRKAVSLSHLGLALVSALSLALIAGCFFLPPPPDPAAGGQQDQSVTDDSGQGSQDAPGDADGNGNNNQGASGGGADSGSGGGFVGPPPPGDDGDDDSGSGGGDGGSGGGDGSGGDGDGGGGDDGGGDDGLGGGGNQVTVALVSIGVNGAAANDESQSGSVSADGRFIAFSSLASNLVPNDENNERDIFLRDRATSTTTRISVGYDGTEANAPSLRPAIAADGGFVVFQSSASNLVANDTNNQSDVFIWDAGTNQISRVSVGSGGVQANGSSENPSLSADGRYVVFESIADNLVVGDTNGLRDVFVHDRQTGQTRCVSEGTGGQAANGASFDPVISADGRLVVFASRARNLVVGDTNGFADIFVRDLVAGQTTRVSFGASGFQTNGDSLDPHVAGSDGRFIVFESDATNIHDNDGNGARDVFLLDRDSGVTVAVSVLASGGTGNGPSGAPMVSADGRFVVFESLASDLVADDGNAASDVFVRDVAAGTTTLWSADEQGVQGNGGSLRPYLTLDGSFVVFESKATNLTQDPVSDSSDIFLRSLGD